MEAVAHMKRLAALVLISTFTHGIAACAEDDGVTGMRGRILEAESERPLGDVEVSIGNDEIGWQTSITDSDGWFELLEYDTDVTLMRIDGRSASTADARYPLVTTQLHPNWIIPGRVVTLAEEKYLPRLDESTAVDLSSVLIPSTSSSHPAEEGWMQIDPEADPVRVAADDVVVPGAEGPEGEPLRTSVYTVLRPGTFVKLPYGADPVMTVTQVPVDQLPHSLPDYVSPTMMVTFQPSGTQIDPPAELRFGDLRNFADSSPDMPFSVWSLSHSRALFLELGDAELQEGPDGPEIATAPGVGLKELGWHGPVCTGVNFEAQVMIREDGGLRNAPKDVLSMRVIGGGTRAGRFDRKVWNRDDGRVKTGMVSSCGGYFRFHFQPKQANPTSTMSSASYNVPRWRCARRAGTNDLGQIIIDTTSGTPRLETNFNLGPC